MKEILKTKPIQISVMHKNSHEKLFEVVIIKGKKETKKTVSLIEILLMFEFIK